MKKKVTIAVVSVGTFIIAVVGAYWWSNTPPKRPSDVSANAVFLWAGHLGLPAPKHGTWIACWTDTTEKVNKCRLTDMNGTVLYEGVFLVDAGENPVPQPDLKIEGEPTSQTNWVPLGGMLAAPLVFLKNGTVLIPKDAYRDGMAKLEHLRQEQGK